jgi:hypothetical protein
VQRLGTELESGRARQQSLQDQITKLFTDLDLDPQDERGLPRLLETWGPWKEEREQQRRLEHEMTELQERLADRRDLRDLSLPVAREKLAQVLEQADRIADLSRERGTIEFELAAAARSTDLEGALAAEAEAREALEQRREEALFAQAGTFLLDAVERERDETSTPAVMRRAQDLFAGFTCGRFELKMRAEDGGVYARDSDRAVFVAVEQLSGGTRAQLLLAARLAFLQSTEGERTLPLILDEALATSDAERFHAVATALLRQAESEGRQLFYLGARSEEIVRWREACLEVGTPEPRVIDLALVRGEAAAIRDPGRLQPRARRLPPPTLSAEEYGAQIAVPRPDPFAAFESWHLFHLLRDDLTLLRRLQGLGIDTLGQWRALTSGGRARQRTAWISDEDAERLEAWSSVVQAFLDHWRVGRSRPLERRDLEDSRSAISKTFIDEVAEQCRQLDGDSVALVQTLRDRGVRNFLQKKAEEFEEYLRSQGLYDDRPRLEESDLVVAVLRDIEDRVATGMLEGEAVRRRIACLLPLVDTTTVRDALETSPEEDVPDAVHLPARRS